MNAPLTPLAEELAPAGLRSGPNPDGSKETDRRSTPVTWARVCQVKGHRLLGSSFLRLHVIQRSVCQ